MTRSRLILKLIVTLRKWTINFKRIMTRSRLILKLIVTLRKFVQKFLRCAPEKNSRESLPKEL